MHAMIPHVLLTKHRTTTCQNHYYIILKKEEDNNRDNYSIPSWEFQVNK